MTTGERADVTVIGAGPAGVFAALRAARLGARTTLVTRDAVGGMAAADGPFRCARWRRPPGCSARRGTCTGTASRCATPPWTTVGCSPGYARWSPTWPSTPCRAPSCRTPVWCCTSMRGPRGSSTRIPSKPTTAPASPPTSSSCARAARTGPLPVPGAELVGSHRDAWTLATVPESLLVIGAGATGAQVASVFAELGSQVMLFEAGPRILGTEDEDVSRTMAASFRAAGIEVREDFGRIRGFEKAPAGVRMIFAKDDAVDSVEAALAVAAIGWLADTAGLNLAAAGVATTDRGYVQVDEHLRTTAPHVFAAGDITGRLMLVPHAVQDGYLAATNAVQDRGATLSPPATPIGSFTDPEYAQVGPTEAQARRDHDVVVAMVPFAVAARPIIDGRTDGFCKLIVDRGTHRILGCHVVGERAVEIAQVAAVAVAAAMPVEQFVRIPIVLPHLHQRLGTGRYRCRPPTRRARLLGRPGAGHPQDLTAKPATATCPGRC